MKTKLSKLIRTLIIGLAIAGSLTTSTDVFATKTWQQKQEEKKLKEQQQKEENTKKLEVSKNKQDEGIKKINVSKNQKKENAKNLKKQKQEEEKQKKLEASKKEKEEDEKRLQELKEKKLKNKKEKEAKEQLEALKKQKEEILKKLNTLKNQKKVVLKQLDASKKQKEEMLKKRAVWKNQNEEMLKKLASLKLEEQKKIEAQKKLEALKLEEQKRIEALKIEEQKKIEKLKKLPPLKTAASYKNYEMPPFCKTENGELRMHFINSKEVNEAIAYLQRWDDNFHEILLTNLSQKLFEGVQDGHELFLDLKKWESFIESADMCRDFIGFPLSRVAEEILRYCDEHCQLALKSKSENDSKVIEEIVKKLPPIATPSEVQKQLTNFLKLRCKKNRTVRLELFNGTGVDLKLLERFLEILAKVPNEDNEDELSQLKLWIALGEGASLQFRYGKKPKSIVRLELFNETGVDEKLRERLLEILPKIFNEKELSQLELFVLLSGNASLNYTSLKSKVLTVTVFEDNRQLYPLKSVGDFLDALKDFDNISASYFKSSGGKSFTPEAVVQLILEYPNLEHIDLGKSLSKLSVDQLENALKKCFDERGIKSLECCDSRYKNAKNENKGGALRQVFIMTRSHNEGSPVTIDLLFKENKVK